MATAAEPAYPARLEVDYPESLDRLTTFFRVLWAIPILVILSLLSATATETATVITESGETITKVTETGAGISGALFAVTLLMILFRQKYPRWWFDFAQEFARFGTRVGAYLGLLTDKYPSTDEEQSVHLDLDYPEVERDLNRWLPLVKWLLALPHFIVLAFLIIGVVVAVVVAWFAISSLAATRGVCSITSSGWGAGGFGCRRMRSC